MVPCGEDSARRSWAAQATQQSMGFGGYAGLDSDRASLSAAPPGPRCSRLKTREGRQIDSPLAATSCSMARGCERCSKEALGRCLVLAEVPGAPEERQTRCEASVGARRHAMRPASLGDLRCVPLGDGPGARRVQDQRTAAGDQPFVVGGVVPGRCIRGQKPGQAGVVIESLAYGVGLDRDLATGIDEVCAKALEDDAGGNN